MVKPSFRSSAWILGAPQIGILVGQATDQIPQFQCNSGSAATRSGVRAPVETEAGAVPPDDGFGFNDDERMGPAGPEATDGAKRGCRRPFSRGRGRMRLRTATCWRRARISREA